MRHHHYRLRRTGHRCPFALSGRLFVGNINFQVEDDTLASLFAQYGTVIDCYILRERDTRASRGFGFVEMATRAEAQAALQALNNYDGDEILRRPLTVEFARPKVPHR